MAKKSIGIVGGGAAGALLTIQLLKNLRSADSALDIFLFEREPRQYLRGIAYSTLSTDHFLNISSFAMSALPDEPEHFVNWLKINCGNEVASQTFALRAHYGRYLEETLQAYLSRAPEGVVFHAVSAEIVGVERAARKWQLTSGEGECFLVDKVILATGGLRSRAPQELSASAARHPRYFQTPWNLPVEHWPRHYSVLFIGSGLSMVDGVVSLAGFDPQARIVAFSCKGLLPRPHANGKVCCPPEPLAILREMEGDGHFSLRADGLRSIDHDGERFIVQWQRRYGAEFFDVVVNAKGPLADFRQTTVTPFRDLIAAGEMVADPTGHGLKVDAELRLLNRQGCPQEDLFVLGVLSDGMLWEVTAVSDIRAQALSVAAMLVSWLRKPLTSPDLSPRSAP